LFLRSYNHWVQPLGSTPCCNSRTARSLFGVSVLWSAPSSSRYRGSNPSSSHCRGANPGFGTLLESLSWCQPLGSTPCCNSRRAPDSTRCSCVVTTEVQPLGSTPCCNSRTAPDAYALFLRSYNHWVQPRAVTTRVVIRGRTPPNSFNTMKGRRFI